jgi:signal transduction histidine kinase
MTRQSHAQLAPHLWLRLPRRTARLRLTVLYGGLVLLSGIALVASTYTLFERATASKAPHLPQIPHTPAIHKLPQPPSPAQAFSTLHKAQQQLQHDQQQIKNFPVGAGGPQPRLELLQLAPMLVRDEHQLAADQHKLARATHELAHAVHQAAQAGAVRAAQRASDSHQLLVDSGIALAAVAVLAVLAGWLVAGRMLRPIRTITRAARRISSTSLHERLGLDGPDDELKELGDTLDNLFARLEAAFEAQRRFVANASHELRTPLTRERTLVQVALAGPSTPDEWRSTGQELLASNREQQTLIDALLTLASSESGLDQREQTDLAEISRSVLARPGLDLHGLHIETALHPAPLDGDPRLIERLVANLVDNASGHNLADGHIQISTDTALGRAVLAVSNSGPIIPPGEIERLFQPFQRLDPRRVQHKNGHGLGLSIVGAIATAHGATISAQSLPKGGLSLHVVFPPPATPLANQKTHHRASVEPGGRNRWQPVATKARPKQAKAGGPARQGRSPTPPNGP